MRIGFDAKRAFCNEAGLGNYSRNLLNALSKYYPDNNYFLFTPDTGKYRLFTPEGNMHLVLPGMKISQVFPSAWRSFGIGSLLLRKRIDLYHGLSHELPFFIENSGIPALVTIHDLIFLRYPQFYKLTDRQIYGNKFRHACNRASRIIAVSQQTRNDLIEFWNIDPNRIDVVYQSCNPIFYERVPERDKITIRERYELPREFILSVGAVERRKNILTLIRAMEEFNIDYPLVIVGRPTEYMNEIKNYLKGKKIGERVYFVHHVPTMVLPAFYQMARAFVYPSFFEGFGIPIIEALASGTPVITSRGGCFPEAGGPGTLYVDPNSAEELADSLEKVLHNETLRARMIAEGQEYAMNFTESKFASGVMDCYRHTLQELGKL
ncbi:MAG: glycosyltransferase family 1 protein [Bacteroidota bacterium]|nr:glycosyltransferase family 1 protein [Bacteroidota bacterium]MDP4205307.1 glycosyltransferase family 1 protein [Bacteroidota bacterium]